MLDACLFSSSMLLSVNLLSGVHYAYSNVQASLSKTVHSTLYCLSGLLPLVYFFTCSTIVFNTQWGSENPALAVLMLFPIYCEMASKHIICSVTKVNSELTYRWNSTHWYLHVSFTCYSQLTNTLWNTIPN